MNQLRRFLKSKYSGFSNDDVYIYVDSLFTHFGIYIGRKGLEVRSDSTEIIGIDLT